MSKNLKYLKKEDLKNFDKFIQKSLDKYIDVELWEDLYKNTGENHKDIISDKSTIPDLVIYNKKFNKLNCFYYENNKKQYITFPRKRFKLGKKYIKEYDPSLSYVIYDSKKEEAKKEQKKRKRKKRRKKKDEVKNDQVKNEEEKKDEEKKDDEKKDEEKEEEKKDDEKKDEEKEEEKKDKYEIFEFKSIPKEKEKEHIGKNKSKKIELFNELNDFMNNGNDNKIKIEIIKNNEKSDINENGKRKSSYNGNNNKNKFSIPKFNNYDDFYNKFVQNLQFQNLMLQKSKSDNNTYKNVNKKFGNLSLETKPLSDLSNKSISDNNNGQKASTFMLKYHSNGLNDAKPEEINFNNYLKDLENFMKENLNERIWIVINEKIKFVHRYNSEELYYLLNNNAKNGELKNYSIYSIFNLKIFISPAELLDILKEIFKKEQEG